MKYMCTYCNIYAYDEDRGDPNTDLSPGTSWEEIPITWQCPVCGMPKTYLMQVSDDAFSLLITAYTKKKRKTGI